MNCNFARIYRRPFDEDAIGVLWVVVVDVLWRPSWSGLNEGGEGRIAGLVVTLGFIVLVAIGGLDVTSLAAAGWRDVDPCSTRNSQKFRWFRDFDCTEWGI